MTRTLVVMAVILSMLTGCSGRSTSDRDIVLVDVAEAMDVVEGRKRLFGLAGSASGTFVDPRSEKAYRDGHIPGAISLPFKYVSQRHDELKGYDVLVVYGADYNDDIAEGMSKRRQGNNTKGFAVFQL